MQLNNIATSILFLFTIGVFISCGGDDEPVTDDDQGMVDMPFTGDIDWLSTIGGSGEDEGNDIVATPDGGYLIVGTTNSTDGAISDKTTTDNDIWVIKADSNGSLVWSKTYGSSQNDKGYGIVATNDGNYVVSGYVSSGDGDVSTFEGFHDYWIFKISPTGDIIWEKSFGFSGSDQAKGLIATNDGGYLVSGFFDVTASGGQGNDLQGGANSHDQNDTRSSGNRQHGVGDYWVIKLDANGNKVWRNFFGGTNDDRSFDLIQTPDNGYLIVGASESTDFDVVDNHGGHDFWIVKVNAAGEKIWTQSFGGEEIDNGYALTSTQDGNYLFVGDTRSTGGDITNPLGNADSWAVKFSPTGSLIWQKTNGGSLFESARGVTNMNNGTYLVTGSSRSTDGDITLNNGLNDAWVYLLDETGAILFEKTVGGSGLDFGISAVKSSDNAIVMTGNTESNDGDITSNNGIKDLLLVKIK